MLPLRGSSLYPRGVLRRLLSGRNGNTRSRHNDENCHVLNQERKSGWKKKKVALVFGYVGKNYRGLQMIDPSVNTIEREVEEALYSLGCILPTNRQKLEKIGWSRSSRTDKGVHAARIVVSAKLLLPSAWLHPSPQGGVKEEEEGEAHRFPALVEQLNSVLPAAIRVFSCTRVNKGFQAREACHWREYEYLIPARLVLPPPESTTAVSAPEFEAPLFRWKEQAQSEEEFVSRLNEVFALMEGSKSMHNYHRKKESRHELQRRQEQKSLQTDTGTDNPRQSNHYPLIGRDIQWLAEEDIGYGAPVAVSGEGDRCDTFSSNSVSSVEQDDYASSEGGEEDSQHEMTGFRFQFKNWQPQILKESTNGSLYRVRAESSSPLTCAAGDVAGATGLEPAEMGMVTVRLRGQGFLMNQIRLMISAAVLYARGIIPLTLIHLSLDTPYRFSFPLAPAEGLLLVDSGYSRNVSGQNYSLHPHHEENAQVGQEEDLEECVLSLMTTDEYNISEEFKKAYIYPEIYQDWNGSDTNELINRWFLHCQEYNVTPQLNAKWESFLNDYREFTAPQLQIKYDIYSRRVVASKEKYKYALKFLQDCQAEAYQFAHEASQLNSRDRQHKDYLKRERNVSRKVKAAHFELPHKLFLPNGTSAALVTKFGVLPGGPVISKALRALAYAVATESRSVPGVFRDAAHVVRHVSDYTGEGQEQVAVAAERSKGGLWAWAEREPISPHIQ